MIQETEGIKSAIVKMLAKYNDLFSHKDIEYVNEMIYQVSKLDSIITNRLREVERKRKTA